VLQGLLDFRDMVSSSKHRNIKGATNLSLYPAYFFSISQDLLT
jgi:hypothetical protein